MSRAAALARSRAVRVAFLLVALGAAAWALAADGEAVLRELRGMPPAAVAVALAASAANVLLAMGAFRTVLADLGSRPPLGSVALVFLLGQLGKYVPGSVWQVVAAAELGSDRGVPRRRTASALALQLALSIATGAGLAVLVLPSVPGGLSRWWPVLVLLPVLAVLLAPPVVGPLLDRLLVLARRAPLEHRPSGCGTALAVAWSLASWAAIGLQVYALAVGVGAEPGWRLLALCVGGFALAWGAGFLVLVAPAGAGVREVALAAVLAGTLDRPAVLVVVLLSRVLLTLADVALALAALAAARVRARRRERAASG